MILQGVVTFFTLLSVIFFPWPFTATLTIGLVFVEPLIPLAVGIFADVLYYTPQAYAFPVFTLYGAICTILALVVRSRLRTGTIQ